VSFLSFQFFRLIKNMFKLGERPAIIAPPESEWYHGRLDRYSAEQRLRGTSKLGSYLGNKNN